MTFAPEEIIGMARAAGSMDFGADSATHVLNINVLQRFAALVAAKEREACEKACEEVARKYEERHRGCYPDGMVPAEMGADDCVEAIRARGQKEGA